MKHNEAAENSAIRLFEQVARVIEHIELGHDPDDFYTDTPTAKKVLAHYLAAQSLGEALFHVCNDPHSNLSKLIFGNNVPAYHEETESLFSTENNRTLQVILHRTGASWSTAALSSSLSASVVLYTDFRKFQLWQGSNQGDITRPFAVFDLREMCDEIAFHGSIWESIFPQHYSILSRTISYTFDQRTKGALFSARNGKSDDLLDEERSAFEALLCLDGVYTNLVNLHEFYSELQDSTKPPKLLAEHVQGNYRLRKYSPDRSLIFDFGQPSGYLSRTDFVTTYNIGNQEFHREFFISSRVWEPGEQEIRIAAFDLLNMLAIRRTKLFRIGFASRIYNILLPPIILTDESSSSDGYVIFPCLNLYRTTQQGFRRTLSLTFVASPITIDNVGRLPVINARSAAIDELHDFIADLLAIGSAETFKTKKSYKVTGPGLFYYQDLPPIINTPSLLQYVSREILQRALQNSKVDAKIIDDIINSTLYVSNLESRIATMSLQISWTPRMGFSQPWEQWIATGEDPVFQMGLFRTLFYSDYLTPHTADASRHAIQLAQFNIGNTLGADMGGMTLYNPQENLKVVLYPSIRESYPNYSIVRWMVWQIYIDSALASLRALIYRFHPILEERRDLHSIIGTLDEMIQEFVDFYDLDLRDFFYRKEYEKLRALMQVDADYEQLLSKFASSKEDESLREQRLINKLVVSLTIATVTITVLTTIAQIEEYSSARYMLVAVTVSAITAWGGYILFDPLRVWNKQLITAVKRRLGKLR